MADPTPLPPPPSTQPTYVVANPPRRRSNPYERTTLIGAGMTGLIHELDDDRVVKLPHTHGPESYPDHLEEMEYINNCRYETLDLEGRIYERLGPHPGIITCYKTSRHGIELAWAKEGDLERYIKITAPAPDDALKVNWILSIIEALAYVHSRRVLIDEIALRNILVHDGRLRFVDFGQSYLLPMTADMDSVVENDLTVKIEILHLGWIIYSIADWQLHKYYYWSYSEEEDPHWPRPEELPSVDHVFCGSIITKCWRGEYINVDALLQDARALLEGKKTMQKKKPTPQDAGWGTVMASWWKWISSSFIPLSEFMLHFRRSLRFVCSSKSDTVE
ncbi:MAG: hypothetical protein M1825_005312 [Sarcosagium campestre]|nr:MAG: hypothetical protein M1825_005312 [Sarcosagium campestre]